MQLNFNKKLITSIVFVVVALLAASGFITYSISSSSLQFLGRQFIANIVQELADNIEMQNSITQEKLDADLGILERDVAAKGFLFQSADETAETVVVNQVSKDKQTLNIPLLKLGDGVFGETVNGNFDLVDDTQKLVGGTATIFQVLPGKLLRVSTNVRKLDGERAVGTYIPEDSPVYKTVMSGETFRGKAFVVNDWYVTAYKPMRDADGAIVAVIYVGRKMMTPQLRELLGKQSYNGYGRAFIALGSGKYAFHKDAALERDGNLNEAPQGKALLAADRSFVEYEAGGEAQVAYCAYFEPWDWHIGFELPTRNILLGTHTRLLKGVGAVILGGALLSVALFWFVLRVLLRPLTQLSETTRRIAEGDLDASCDYDGQDAIGETVRSVGAMVAELKERLGFTQGVLEGIPTPCGIVGPDFKMVWANHRMCELLEKTGRPDEFVGQGSGEFFWNEKGRETLSDKAIRQNKTLNHQMTYTAPSGRTLHVDVTATPFYDLDGTMQGSISFWFDLTSVKEGEERIRRQNEQIATAAASANSIADRVFAASRELEVQLDEASEGASSQSARMGEMAAAIEEMNATTLEVARNAGEAAESAESARGIAEQGARVVEDVIRSAEEVSAHSETMSATLQTLGQQAEGIGHIIGVINDIADQTNLLALNAAIEAARAGDAGRGFAVVADEVRKLAEKTMTATKEVEEVVRGIQGSTTQTLSHMEDVSRQMRENTGKTHEAGKSLQSILETVLDTADRVRSIATAAEEQSATSEQIARTTESVTELAGQSAQAVRQSSEAVADLARLAQELTGLMDDLRGSG